MGVVELSITPDILFGKGRLESTFGHPNIFAYFIVSNIALILFLTRSTLVRLAPARRQMLHAYIMALLLLLLLTKARTAWVAMTLIFVGHAIFVDRRWLAFLLVLPAALSIPGVADRMSDLYTGNIEGGFATLNSYAFRKVLWARTLQWMSDNPSLLLGYGLNLYKSYLPLFLPSGTDEPIGAHNTFLQIYFEMGLIGLTAFLSIFVALFVQLARGYTHHRDGAIVMALLCVAYLTVCYPDNVLDYLNFQWFFWFVLGTVLAWMRLWPRSPTT